MPASISASAGTVCQASKSPQWPSSLNSLTRSFFTRQPVDTVTINSAITGCAKARRWRQVLLLLSACMNNLALQPDLLTTTLYLTSCTTANWHRAVAFLHRFALGSDAFCLDGGVLGLIPDTVFFNGVLRVFERGGLWRQAARLFTRLQVAAAEKDAVGLTTVLTASAKASSWMSSVSILGMSQSDICFPNVFSYNAILNAYAIISSWTLSACLMLDMHLATIQPDVVSLNTMAAACKPAGAWAKSLELLPYLDSFGLASVAGSCGAAAQWRRAVLLWVERLHSGLGLVECNAILNACAEGEAWESCLSLLEHALLTGPEPNLVTFGCVGKALQLSRSGGARSRPAWELPLSLVAKYQQSGFKSVRGLKSSGQDSGNLNVFLGSCVFTLAQSLQWQQGTAMFAALQMYGDEAQDPVLSRSMQQGLLQTDGWRLGLQIGRVRAAQTAAKSSCMDMESEAVLAVRSWCTQTLWTRAVLSLAWDGRTASSKAHTMLLESYVTSADGWARALSHVSRMFQVRLRPDTLTHGIAVGTCRSHLQWQWCLVCALDACLRYPGQPLAALCNGAMVACCDAGEQKLLPRLLREARELHVKLDVISFNTCISASEKLTKWPLSLQLLQVTYSTRVQADCTTYEAAITSCEQGSSWTYGLRLLMQLRMRATPTVSSYNAVMGSEMRVRWSEALQLFAELRANQQLPDMITHVALSSALQGSHQWKLLLSNLPHVRAEAMARLRVKKMRNE
ncbi:unnamed protein product [Symbiodinium sp. CCMP2592]|nr:unnamed protein product [Symbiodinium sp. CCMP2592]